METKTAIDGFLQSVKFSRSHKTYVTYSQALKTFQANMGADALLTTETYAGFLQSLRDYSPSTQAIYKTAVHGLYAYYAENGGSVNLLALQSAARRFVKKKGRRLPQFDRDGIERVLKFSAGLTKDMMELRDRAFILTLADTGLRISEACSLRRGDIDWNERKALVIGKGDKQAVVRFSSRSLTAVKDYLDARAKLDGASGKPLTSLPVFARHDKKAGKRILKVSSNGMWQSIKQRIKAAGVPPESIRLHDFRHYFVTVVYMATGDLKAAQELARHADAKTTSLYAHLGGAVDKIYDDVFNKQTR